jgi:hypothetical protein
MKTTVYFFLKFFQQEWLARAFVAGQLRCRPGTGEAIAAKMRELMARLGLEHQLGRAKAKA